MKSFEDLVEEARLEILYNETLTRCIETRQAVAFYSGRDPVELATLKAAVQEATADFEEAGRARFRSEEPIPAIVVRRNLWERFVDWMHRC